MWSRCARADKVSRAPTTEVTTVDTTSAAPEDEQLTTAAADSHFLGSSSAFEAPLVISAVLLLGAVVLALPAMFVGAMHSAVMSAAGDVPFWWCIACDALLVLLVGLPYTALCLLVRAQAWVEAQAMGKVRGSCEETTPSLPNAGLADFDKQGRQRILTTIAPVSNGWVMWHFWLVHTPASALALLRLVLVIWPRLLSRAVVRREATGTWAAPVTAEDIFKQVTRTSLMMLITPRSDDPNTIVMKVPDHVGSSYDSSTLAAGAAPFRQSPAGLTIVLDVEQQRAVSATRRGEDLTTDWRRVSSFLAFTASMCVN
jgi:hypothetical protein